MRLSQNDDDDEFDEQFNRAQRNCINSSITLLDFNSRHNQNNLFVTQITNSSNIFASIVLSISFVEAIHFKSFAKIEQQIYQKLNM